MLEPIPELDFHIGGPGGWKGPGITIKVKGSQLRYWKDQWPTQPSTICKELLSQDWQRFLERLSELDFWNWLSRYHPEELILDGTVWSVRVSHGEVTQKSSGENAYPADSDVKAISTGEYSQRFNFFLDALTELVGQVPIR